MSAFSTYVYEHNIAKIRNAKQKAESLEFELNNLRERNLVLENENSILRQRLQGES